jgi:hypothetical protein
MCLNIVHQFLEKYYLIIKSPIYEQSTYPACFPLPLSRSPLTISFLGYISNNEYKEEFLSEYQISLLAEKV